MNSSLHFKTPTLFCNLLALVIGAAWVSFLCCRPIDHTTAPPKAFTAAKTGEQAREQVRKDLWIAQSPTKRTHDRIESNQSRLIFRPTSHSLELIELLEGVQGWIEEKQAAGSQGAAPTQLRHFSAQEGVYFYKDQRFKAFHALLSFYKIEGDPLHWNQSLHTPFLQGTAECLDFSLQGDSPLFRATHFSASLKGEP